MMFINSRKANKLVTVLSLFQRRKVLMVACCDSALERIVEAMINLPERVKKYNEALKVLVLYHSDSTMICAALIPS